MCGAEEAFLDRCAGVASTDCLALARGVVSYIFAFLVAAEAIHFCVVRLASSRRRLLA